MTPCIILFVVEFCLGIVSATSVADSVSASDVRLHVRTYSGYNREYVSYTSHGTLVIEEQDLLTRTYSSDGSSSGSVATIDATDSSSIVTTSVKRDSSSTLSFTSLEPIPSLTCPRPENQNNQSTNGRFESISCCDNLHSQWSEAYSRFQETFQSSLLFTSWEVKSFRTNHFTVAKCDGPFTTLCDGVVRAMCSPSTPQPALELQPASQYFSSPTGTSQVATTAFPIPRPECVISPAECDGLWNYMADELASWSKVHGFHDGWSNAPKPENGTDPEVPSESEPGSQNPQCSGTKKDACLRCVFHSETVQLLYWNVNEVDESFLCKAGNSTSVAEESAKFQMESAISSQVMTAKWGTFTLTSPTVYAFYTTMKDEGGCGSTHTSVLIPIDPTEVSTMVWRAETDYGPFVSRVDWRHFAYKTQGSLSYPLIPRSAYCGDHRQMLMDDACNTIYHDYRPGLDFRIVGDVLGRVDPAWRYCRNGQQMAFDPPIAMQPTARIAIPSLPAQEPVVGAQNSLMPAATQAGPFPAVTPSPGQPGGISDPGVKGDAQIGAQISINLPKITASKVSLITIFASPGEIHPIPGATEDPVLSTGGFGDQQNPTAIGRRPINGGNVQQDEAVFTVSGRKYTAHSLASDGGFEIEGSTALAGGKPITVDGVAVSAFNGGVVVGIDSESGFNGLDQPSSRIGLESNAFATGSDSRSSDGLAASSSKSKGKKSGVIGHSDGLVSGLHVLWRLYSLWAFILRC